nr:3377_t:CDS:10 [Entrophospora candida]
MLKNTKNIELRYAPPKKVNARYSKQELVGRGAYGAVYKGIDNDTSKVVAIKVLNLDTEEDDVDDIIKEINLLSQIKQSDSRNITRYYGSFLHGTKLWIIMEYAAGGNSTKEVIQALIYLHRCKIIHRDIKAANILLTAEGKVQLCDFGVAGQLTASSTKRTSFVGTPYWMAPEVIIEGITVYEIATGNPPYHDQNAMKAIQLIPKKPPARLEGVYSQHLKELRPTADDLLKIKFVKSANKHQNGILRDLIARFEHWKQTTGYRQSFSDPSSRKSSHHRKSRSLGSLTNFPDKLSPVVEKKEEKTMIPRDATIRYGRILADELMSPTKPMYLRKYSENQHPLQLLFNTDDQKQQHQRQNSGNKDSYSKNFFDSPTISIPSDNDEVINFSDLDGPPSSRTMTKELLQSQYDNQTKDASSTENNDNVNGKDGKDLKSPEIIVPFDPSPSQKIVLTPVEEIKTSNDLLFPNSASNNDNKPSLNKGPFKFMMTPVRHESYDALPLPNNNDLSSGIPLYRSKSQGKEHPQYARRVRSATTLNQTKSHAEELLGQKKINNNNSYYDDDDDGYGINTKINGNLALNVPRQRSVSDVQKTSKAKLLVEEPGQINYLLPPPLKMDNYRGTSEVFEDLTKTTEDFLQWMILLDAGISQLLTRS